MGIFDGTIFEHKRTDDEIIMDQDYEKQKQARKHQSYQQPADDRYSYHPYTNSREDDMKAVDQEYDAANMLACEVDRTFNSEVAVSLSHLAQDIKNLEAVGHTVNPRSIVSQDTDYFMTLQSAGNGHIRLNIYKNDVWTRAAFDARADVKASLVCETWPAADNKINAFLYSENGDAKGSLHMSYADYSQGRRYDNNLTLGRNNYSEPNMDFIKTLKEFEKSKGMIEKNRSHIQERARVHAKEMQALAHPDNVLNSSELEDTGIGGR